LACQSGSCWVAKGQVGETPSCWNRKAAWPSRLAGIHLNMLIRTRRATSIDAFHRRLDRGRSPFTTLPSELVYRSYGSIASRLSGMYAGCKLGSLIFTPSIASACRRRIDFGTQE
jgi:hypothetical protein